MCSSSIPGSGEREVTPKQTEILVSMGSVFYLSRGERHEIVYKWWAQEVVPLSKGLRVIRKEPQCQGEGTGPPHLLFLCHSFKNISCFSIFCFTSLDIWDELFLLLSLVTLNFMTSCSGLPPNFLLLPLGNYICVCHLPSGHAGEHRDK